MRRIGLGLAAAVLWGGAALAQGPAPGAAPAPAVSNGPNDYTQDSAWLCRPGRKDACAVDLSTTSITADGKLKIETFTPAANPPIDCFYVYPTVSRDPTPNSDMTAGPEELNVAKQQFARFSARCRLFAPLYRQVTLAALRAAMTGHPVNPDRSLAYRDVAAAWRDYLARDNHGRGVVLIGHSQGSGLLTQLIRREIDGQPVQARVISAILGGTNLAVPPGKDVGGAFKSFPVCRSPGQLHCVIAFASFRASSPPPADTRFGVITANQPEYAGLSAACANPAALGGGSGALDAYLPAGSDQITENAAPPSAWTRPAQPISTPFVRLPGLLSGACVTDAHGSYLAVTIKAEPGARRTSDIPGDVVLPGGRILKDWGLHLIDMNLTQGNLLEVVRAQTAAWLASPEGRAR